MNRPLPESENSVADRALEADLREALGLDSPEDPYPALASVLAKAEPAGSTARWVRAAALLLGAGVVFAVGWSLGRVPEASQPAGGQDPAPPRVEYCADLEALAAVESEAQGLAVVGMTDGEWARLGRFGELRTLAILRGTPTPGTDWDDPAVDMLSDAVWERLAAFRKLERFQLTLGGRVTGEGAELLGRLPLLRAVEIHGTWLSVAGCEALAGLASVQRLHVTACGLGDEQAAALAAARGVRDLALRDNLMSTAALVTLAGLPELRALDLGGMTVNVDVLRAAVASGRLERLDLRRCRGLSAGALAVLRGSGLEQLQIAGATLDAGAEAVIADLEFDVER